MVRRLKKKTQRQVSLPLRFLLWFKVHLRGMTAAQVLSRF